MSELQNSSEATSQAASADVARLACADVALESGIRGQAILRADDFGAAWLALPQTRLTLTWLVLLPAIPIVTLLVSDLAINSTLLVTLGVGLLVAGYGVQSRRARFIKAGLRGGDSKSMQYAFDAEGYHITAPDWESRVAWSALHQQSQTDRLFLIFTTPKILTIVPKRAFAAAQRVLLERELLARVPAGTAATPASIATKWVMLFVAFLATWHFFGR